MRSQNITKNGQSGLQMPPKKSGAPTRLACVVHILDIQKNNEDSFGLRPNQPLTFSLLPHFHFFFPLTYSLSSFLTQLLLLFLFSTNRVSIMHTPE